MQALGHLGSTVLPLILYFSFPGQKCRARISNFLLILFHSIQFNSISYIPISDPMTWNKKLKHIDVDHTSQQGDGDRTNGLMEGGDEGEKAGHISFLLSCTQTMEHHEPAHHLGAS